MVNLSMSRLLAAGLSVIPTGEDKRPVVDWKAFQARRATVEESQGWAPAHGLGVICGPVSGGLFCIDVDQKNDPSKKLMREYADLIREQAPDLLSRVVVERTPSGGFHIVARCAKVIPNLKLARTRDRQVLIETRGEGGYFCADPTPGYKLERGTLEAIPEIQPEELEILLDCARALNQEERELTSHRKALANAVTPLDDYDAKTSPEETAQLLEAHGWRIVARRGEAIYLMRPQKTGRGISATLNHIPGRFYCFTTSTAFESEHVYKPYAVFAILEHAGDFHAAAKALAARGYGEKPKATPVKTADGIASKLLDLYDHGMKKGVSPGWEQLSKLYQVVKGQLNIVTGIPSHGKSEFVDALMVNLATAHDWRFVVYSPENYPVELHARKLIEKVSGKNFFGMGRLTRDNVQLATEWILKHFTFLDGTDEDVTLDSIFQAVEGAGRVDGVVIDPWNELESTRPEKMTETDFIGLCLKRCRLFARKKEIAFWVVAHPYKLRKDQKTNKYPIPTMYDISGSAHWYNKADNGITVWRDFDLKETQIIVQKVKFKYYGKPGTVSMRYDLDSGRYTEMQTADHFVPPDPRSRQLPEEDLEEIPF